MKYAKIKRILDVFFAVNFSVICFPVLLITAIAVRLDSKGPIIFKQLRMGKNGTTFTIYKFRSMSSDNDVFNFGEKDKVTKVGKVLRKYGLDELPQLFNVIKGDMSLIGPRPYILEYGDYYTSEQMKRFDVLPGMLGPNVCSRQKHSILEKNRFDDLYVDNYSLKQDFKLFSYAFRNCFSIFSSRGEDSIGNKNGIQEELNCLKENFYNVYGEVKQEKELTIVAGKKENRSYVSNEDVQQRVLSVDFFDNDVLNSKPYVFKKNK